MTSGDCEGALGAVLRMDPLLKKQDPFQKAVLNILWLPLQMAQRDFNCLLTQTCCLSVPITVL